MHCGLIPLNLRRIKWVENLRTALGGLFKGCSGFLTSTNLWQHQLLDNLPDVLLWDEGDWSEAEESRTKLLLQFPRCSTAHKRFQFVQYSWLFFGWWVNQRSLFRLLIQEGLQRVTRKNFFEMFETRAGNSFLGSSFRKHGRRLFWDVQALSLERFFLHLVFAAVLPINSQPISKGFNFHSGFCWRTLDWRFGHPVSQTQTQKRLYINGINRILFAGLLFRWRFLLVSFQGHFSCCPAVREIRAAIDFFSCESFQQTLHAFFPNWVLPVRWNVTVCLNVTFCQWPFLRLWCNTCKEGNSVTKTPRISFQNVCHNFFCVTCCAFLRLKPSPFIQDVCLLWWTIKRAILGHA